MEMEIRAARAAEKRPVYTSVLTRKLLKARLVRATHKDKDCITLSFPPFGGLPIVFI